MIERVANLSPQMSKVTDETSASDQTANSQALRSGDAQGVKLQMTTGTIAAKLNAKTGPDLIIAAAARLTLVMEATSVQRKDLLKEMKSATGYYNKVFSNNLSRYLQQLVKQKKLHGESEDTYSLTPTTRSELEARLAQ